MPKSLDASGYDTDKPPVYLRNYERFFGPLCGEPVRLLELGVRTGGSLRMWRDYFERGTIVGLDARVERQDLGERIHICEGRQEDREALNRIAADFGPFDIVIDDASHIAALARASFWHLFDHHLKSGGLYAIEDWGTGYWGAWPDGRVFEDGRDGGHTHGMVGLIKELVDEVAMEDITRPGSGAGVHRGSKFAALHVFHGQAFVIKA